MKELLSRSLISNYGNVRTFFDVSDTEVEEYENFKVSNTEAEECLSTFRYLEYRSMINVRMSFDNSNTKT